MSPELGFATSIKLNRSFCDYFRPGGQHHGLSLSKSRVGVPPRPVKFPTWQITIGRGVLHDDDVHFVSLNEEVNDRK